MKRYTCDTSVIIARKLYDFPDNFCFTSVVLSELLSASKDETERKYYEALMQEYFDDNDLIIPTFEDWLMASKVLYWLARKRKKQAGGKSPKLKAGASQRMAFDALIAVSCKRADVTLITENWDDFKAIQYYCPVQLSKASDFFQ